MNSRPLQITASEQDALGWCYLALTEEQILECEEEADEIAGIELHQAEAAELLVRTLARIRIRNVRAEMNRATTEPEDMEEDAEEVEEEAAADEGVNAAEQQQGAGLHFDRPASA
jgi:hypothetical protein